MKTPSFLEKNPLKPSRNVLRWSAYSILGLAVIILIAGYFVSLANVEMPGKQDYPFPEDAYKPATAALMSEGGAVTLADDNLLLDFAEPELSSYRPQISQVVQSAFGSIKGKKVVFTITGVRDRNHVIFAKIDELVMQLQSEIATLEGDMDNMSYYEANNARRQIQNAQSRISNIRSFGDALLNTGISPVVTFPVSNQTAEFRYLLGYPSEVNFNQGNNTCILMTLNAHPIVDLDLLTKANLTVDNESKAIIAQAKSSLNAITNNDKEQKINELKATKKQAQRVRRNYRGSFYGTWFGYLFHLIFSIVSVGLLWQYFIIILRRNVPRKSTHHIYFATNVSSKLFRWLAWIITLGGLLMIVIEIFGTIITGEVLFGLPVGLFLSFIVPLGIVLATVIGSWLFILKSEFICAISNVYHILFLKAYEGIEPELNKEK